MKNKTESEQLLKRAMKLKSEKTGLPYTMASAGKLLGQKPIEKKCECGEPAYDQDAQGVSYCMTCLQRFDEIEMEEARISRNDFNYHRHKEGNVP